MAQVQESSSSETHDSSDTESSTLTLTTADDDETQSREEVLAHIKNMGFNVEEYRLRLHRKFSEPMQFALGVPYTFDMTTLFTKSRLIIQNFKENPSPKNWQEKKDIETLIALDQYFVSNWVSLLELCKDFYPRPFGKFLAKKHNQHFFKGKIYMAILEIKVGIELEKLEDPDRPFAELEKHLDILANFCPPLESNIFQSYMELVTSWESGNDFEFPFSAEFNNFEDFQARMENMDFIKTREIVYPMIGVYNRAYQTVFNFFKSFYKQFNFQ